MVNERTNDMLKIMFDHDIVRQSTINYIIAE